MALHFVHQGMVGFYAYIYKNDLCSKLVQRNLDLRKILGVTKIFLTSRFFLISSITLQNESLEQYKCLNALILSNTSDYIFKYLVGKCGNIVFENYKNLIFFL